MRILKLAAISSVIAFVILGQALSSLAVEVGTRLWSLPVTTPLPVSSPDEFDSPIIVSSQSGGSLTGQYHVFWVVKSKTSSDANRIYWRLFDNNGPVSAVKLVAGGASAPAGAITMGYAAPVSDNAGGAYFTFVRDNGLTVSLIIKRIDSNGNETWSRELTSDDLSNPSFPDYHYPLSLVPHPGVEGGAVVLVRRQINPSSPGYDLNAIYFKANGDNAWGGSGWGKGLTGNVFPQDEIYHGRLEPVQNTGFNLLWRTGTGCANPVIQTQPRVNYFNLDGTVERTVPVMATCQTNSFPTSSVQPDGSMIVTWIDNRIPQYGVYAQKISAATARLWGDEGKTVYDNPGGLTLGGPKVVSDSAGGGIVFWKNGVDANGLGLENSQHVDSDGNVKWPAPVAIHTSAGGNKSGTASVSYSPASHRAFVVTAQHNGTEGGWYITSLDDNGEPWQAQLPVCQTLCSPAVFPSGYTDSSGGDVTPDNTGGTLAAVVNGDASENITISRFASGPPGSAGNFTLYDSVLQITNGTETLELGNAGQDIASTGNIYIRPGGGSVATSFFAPDSASGTQQLVLDAGATGLDALRISADNGKSALYAQQDGAGSAASFSGNVTVSGVVTVDAPHSKSDKLTTGRGDTYLQAIESPDVVFEDFGRARLRNSSAVVKLDPTFLETVEGPYTVSLTAEGALADLRVVEQKAMQFTVRGEPDVAFSYRVSAQRKGYAGERFTIPELQP